MRLICKGRGVKEAEAGSVTRRGQPYFHSRTLIDGWVGIISYSSWLHASSSRALYIFSPYNLVPVTSMDLSTKPTIRKLTKAKKALSPLSHVLSRQACPHHPPLLQYISRWLYDHRPSINNNISSLCHAINAFDDRRLSLSTSPFNAVITIIFSIIILLAGFSEARAAASCCGNIFSGCTGVGTCNILCCNCAGGCLSHNSPSPPFNYPTSYPPSHPPHTQSPPLPSPFNLLPAPLPSPRPRLLTSPLPPSPPSQSYLCDACKWVPFLIDVIYLTHANEWYLML